MHCTTNIICMGCAEHHHRTKPKTYDSQQGPSVPLSFFLSVISLIERELKCAANCEGNHKSVISPSQVYDADR